MLSKMGWSPGKGLGINEDGEKEYIKLSIKQDNLGIGATKKTIDNWLDNSSAFDELLKGLNDKILEESDEKEKNGKESEQYNSDVKTKIDKVESKKKKKKKKENGNKNKDKDITSISNLQISSSLSTANSESLNTIGLA
jgi:Pin2-interacting protein X1